MRFKRKLQDSKFYETLGLCDASTQTVYIKEGQSEFERLRIWIHEVGHAFEAEYGVEIPHGLLEKLDRIIARFLLDNFL